MKSNTLSKKMPPFTIFKREGMNKYLAMGIRVGVVFVSIIISLFLSNAFIKEGIFDISKTLVSGAVALPWRLIQDTFILLGFGIAIVPVFKMKYWNMGANGQVLIGALVSMLLMFYLEKNVKAGQLPNFVLIIMMLLASIIASVIWAVIPAIFKVAFKTNETLFTLMMNYIAAGLVAYFNYILTQGKKETPGIVNSASRIGWLPEVINKYFIPVIIILVITVLIYFYIGKTKHGYEIIVIGDSYNTAKYVGMNTTKIIIRTLILSGAITGVIGFLYVSGINHSLSTSTGGSLGFTGVLVAWLSNFNPIIMFVVSLLLSFLTLGTSSVTSTYRLGSNNLSNIIIGLIFFSILISEFFIRYRVRANFDYKKIFNIFKKKKEVK